MTDTSRSERGLCNCDSRRKTTKMSQLRKKSDCRTTFFRTPAFLNLGSQIHISKGIALVDGLGCRIEFLRESWGQLMEKLIFIDSLIKMPLMDLPVRSVLVPVSEGSVLISPAHPTFGLRLASSKGSKNLRNHNRFRRAISIFASFKAA